MKTKRPHCILWIADEQLLTSPYGNLGAAPLTALGKAVEFETLSLNTTDEDQLIQKLQAQGYLAVLIPASQYQKWNRLQELQNLLIITYQVHNLSIEPIQSKGLLEPPFPSPGLNGPEFKPLPDILRSPSKPPSQPQPKPKLRIVKSLSETATPKQLLAEFQKRYFEAQLEIRKLQVQLDQMQRTQARPQSNARQIQALQMKITRLARQEKEWMDAVQSLIRHLSDQKQVKSKPSKK